MPTKNPRLLILLDLLRPQGSPEKLPVKFLRWLLSSGRYTFIFVEALVLVAFITRFKLDADLANTKEAIEQEIPFIESLKSYEILIRRTQLNLSAISAFRINTPDYTQILRRISDQTPTGVKITSLRLEKGVGKLTIVVTAQSQTNNDLSNFINGLKDDRYFSQVSLASAGLEQGLIRFVVNADAQLKAIGGKNL